MFYGTVREASGSHRTRGLANLTRCVVAQLTKLTTGITFIGLGGGSQLTRVSVYSGDRVNESMVCVRGGDHQTGVGI